MEEYRKKYLENTEEEKEEEGAAEERPGEKTRKGRGFLKKLSLNRLVRGIA